jgi:hypothetical protein
MIHYFITAFCLPIVAFINDPVEFMQTCIEILISYVT